MPEIKESLTNITCSWPADVFSISCHGDLACKIRATSVTWKIMTLSCTKFTNPMIFFVVTPLSLEHISVGYTTNKSASFQLLLVQEVTAIRAKNVVVKKSNFMFLFLKKVWMAVLFTAPYYASGS